MTEDPHALAEPAIEAAIRAGEAILDIYGGEFEVETKQDQSPFTAADRASHELIIAALRRLTPEVPVWSEESATIPFAERRDWNRFWLIDPLDGTREFIKRNGEFTVNIALIDGHEPILGVVHVPVRAQTYLGCRGGGAFVRDASGAQRELSVATTAATPVRVVGSRSHRGASLEAFLAAVGPHVMLPMGSSLKFCLVASGEADVYPRLGPTSEWDTAAAQAVVEAAGGAVVDLDGAPIRYNTKPEVLNPYFIVFADFSKDWLAYVGNSNAS